MSEHSASPWKNRRAPSSQVGLSRAKVRENLLIMQPFSPALFGHGPPVGPHVLMRLLRGELAPGDVEAEFDRWQEQKKLEGCETELMAMHWECKAICVCAMYICVYIYIVCAACSGTPHCRACKTIVGSSREEKACILMSDCAPLHTHMDMYYALYISLARRASWRAGAIS